MCGRFSLAPDVDLLLEEFELTEAPGLVSRWNIAPTQPILVVEETDGRRTTRDIVWGLIPFYSKDGKHPLVNVRGETVLEKPFFRKLWERGHRCLIPATGFYEWKALGKGRKQPFHFAAPDHPVFAFAGLWDRYRDGDTTRTTCTILTTTPNAVVASLHDRMPVIVPRESYSRWLTNPSEDTLRDLLQPAPDAVLRCFPVSTFVNAADHEGPECIVPIDEAEPTLF